MDIVLGVSMTPTAVRMALVDGKDADGVTLDQNSFDVALGVSAATSDAPEQVVAAILGTRESAAEGGHHLVATGVAWTDHAAAARLRQVLRAQRVDDVMLVSELHAASALAKAIGQAVDCERTALLFVERDTATLAVVNTADGSVLRVNTRSLQDTDAVTELRDLVDGLESTAHPPQTLFMVGSGVAIAALKSQIAVHTGLPVHAPEDGELALARGAALAAASIPRYEASTVGLVSQEDTAAGPTQMAVAGYMAPLGYSAMPDGDVDDPAPDLDVPEAADDRSPFLLVGSAVATVFVVGVVALAVSLAVAIRPAADQRPAPSDSAVISNSPAPAAPQAQPSGPPAGAPETIQAPIPVVQEAPRTVFVTPRVAVPAPAPAAPAPEPAPALAPSPAPQPAPAPAPEPAPAPVPAVAPPIVLPVPILPRLLPPIFQAPARSAPVPRGPSTSPSTPAPTTSAPSTSYPTYTPPVTPQAPSSGSDTSGAQSGSDTGSGTGSQGSRTVWPPLWPFGG